ncbi:hypothetical protein Taro_033383, partial [Colocasia esculenta]|nr:hypothetical protein [Colocasia esculenta]
NDIFVLFPHPIVFTVLLFSPPCRWHSRFSDSVATACPAGRSLLGTELRCSQCPRLQDGVLLLPPFPSFLQVTLYLHPAVCVSIRVFGALESVLSIHQKDSFGQYEQQADVRALKSLMRRNSGI